MSYKAVQLGESVVCGRCSLRAKGHRLSVSSNMRSPGEHTEGAIKEAYKQRDRPAFIKYPNWMTTLVFELHSEAMNLASPGGSCDGCNDIVMGY